MSKGSVLLIVVIVLALAGAGVVGYLLLAPQKSIQTGPGTALRNLLPAPAVGDKIYQDASGFSFSYPGNLTIKDETPEDSDYYSFLTLAKGPESMTLSAQDEAGTSLEAWLKTSVAPQGLTLSGATTLGGLPAKQYTSETKLYTLVLDQGVLYLLESPKTGNWEEVHNEIVSSFAFAGQASRVTGGDEAIYEDEEVVE